MNERIYFEIVGKGIFFSMEFDPYLSREKYIELVRKTMKLKADEEIVELSFDEWKIKSTLHSQSVYNGLSEFREYVLSKKPKMEYATPIEPTSPRQYGMALMNRKHRKRH